MKKVLSRNDYSLAFTLEELTKQTWAWVVSTVRADDKIIRHEVNGQAYFLKLADVADVYALCTTSFKHCPPTMRLLLHFDAAHLYTGSITPVDD